MAKINSAIDTSNLLRKMGVAINDIPKVAAHALNLTAETANKNVQIEMRAVFDRPTPFTLNAVRVSQAKPTANPNALVILKDDGVLIGQHYLLPQINGGTRQQKRSERALLGSGQFVPGSALKRDAYGNVSRGVLAKVLAQTRRASDKYTNETEKSRARREKREIKKQGYSSNYFIIKAGAPRKQSKHLTPGIWERVVFSTGSAVRPVFVQTKGAANYRKRFHLHETIQRTFDRDYEPNLRKAVARYFRDLGT